MEKEAAVAASLLRFRVSMLSEQTTIGRVCTAHLLLFFPMVLSLCGCGKDRAGPKTDTQRMEDVHEIAAVIEKYHKETGRYPYAENWSNVSIQGFHSLS